ncbi:type IV pilus biogenesis/stability protein PilW [Thioalkalivibrio paradoxus]|uniref:Pilus biosynthesis protein PilW n=1 Tax=Thioalkalivibrio paradoxus ARh 1 TaxID=713585 RepID=W0DNL5_9GAMM|nr:type IV pilus biogenesis/stability protein PilW [Thioalkalivibrio paradoxus]AHE98837.1 pilus biosynthesis protein PilW [Thioalkalivibrio paradoxus ARh 1]
MSRVPAARPTVRVFRIGFWLLVASLLAGCAGLQPQASDDQRRAAEINAELGVSYLRQNELAQAQRALERSLQFDPNLALAHLGMASLRERQGALDSAEEHYRRALSLDRRDPYAQTNLGDLLCRKGDYREGLELLERAIANPSYPARGIALLSAGKCHARAGDRERAEERLREALRIDPESPEALYELAQLTFEAGRPFQTRAFLSRLEALGIVMPESLLLCYRAETQLGNAEDARRCADRLKRDFRDSDEAATLLREERQRG